MLQLQKFLQFFTILAKTKHVEFLMSIPNKGALVPGEGVVANEKEGVADVP